jgi:hypothetical protein
LIREGGHGMGCSIIMIDFVANKFAFNELWFYWYKDKVVIPVGNLNGIRS